MDAQKTRGKGVAFETIIERPIADIIQEQRHPSFSILASLQSVIRYEMEVGADGGNGASICCYNFFDSYCIQFFHILHFILKKFYLKLDEKWLADRKVYLRG